MSDISEKEWKSALTSILEDLEKWEYMKMLECLDKIPKNQKTCRSREKMPQKILQYYGLEGSISAINDAMVQIPRMDSRVQDKLRPFMDKLREREKVNMGKKRKREPEDEEKRPPAGRQESCRPDGERTSQSWRKNIHELNSGGQLLKTDAIIGKVVKKSGLRTYQTKDKVKKYFCYLAVADETASIKMMVYGKKRYQDIKEEKSYLFRKLLKDEKCVKVTTLSSVSETRSVEVPEELEVAAPKLIYSESPVCSIAEAKVSADKTGVSVEGTVTEIDPVEPVKVNDERRKTKKQDFHLKDETDNIRICMWGEHTKLCKGLSVGDVIKVTNMKISHYYETVSLSSTRFTRIDKVQSVGIQNVRIEIIGIGKTTTTETRLDAEFNDQVHTFVVASRLLAEAFGFKLGADFKGSLLDKIPLEAEAVMNGNKIIKITAA